MDINRIEKAALDHIVSIPLVIFAALFGMLWIALGALVPDDIKNQAMLRLLVALSGSLLLFCLLLVTYIILLKRNLNQKHDFTLFAHDPNRQCWIHKKTGQRICEVCKSGDKLTPLSKFGSGWKCPLHNTVVDCYPNNGERPFDTGELIPTIDP